MLIMKPLDLDEDISQIFVDLMMCLISNLNICRSKLDINMIKFGYQFDLEKFT